uniref:Cytochrome c oxidase subunit 7A2 like n=1 Tax=Vombatus ursinus TaxID=29139 RepID=A0A4X2LT98_VOMUR
MAQSLGFTQKLAGSWTSAPYSPQGLKPVASSEAPPIIFATPMKFASEAAPYDYAGKNKVPELQKFFQQSDGLPETVCQSPLWLYFVGFLKPVKDNSYNQCND